MTWLMYEDEDTLGKALVYVKEALSQSENEATIEVDRQLQVIKIEGRLVLTQKCCIGLIGLIL